MSKKKPTSLSLDELLEVLEKSGSQHASREAIEADRQQGMPTNPDGTFNLIHVMAWLLNSLNTLSGSGRMVPTAGRVIGVSGLSG